jgi:hypothetical protein
MNRHERRRLAAINRGRQTGYLHRLVSALDGAKVGVHIASIEHDPSCGIYRGKDCDCCPDISVSGPDGITVVDEDGISTRQARQ